jgi:hypothetical protein
MTANNESVKQRERPQFINYRLSNDYIRGLTDGEGCFTFYPVKNKRAGMIVLQKIPAFVINMHARDRWLLTEIAEYLHLKSNLYIYKGWVSDGYKRGATARFIVRSAAEFKEIIIPFFYKKLAGFKAIQFKEWLETIGSDPAVPQRYKDLYELAKSGYWEGPKNIPDWLSWKYCVCRQTHHRETNRGTCLLTNKFLKFVLIYCLMFHTCFTVMSIL